MPFYLAIKEMLRNKFRFLVISMIVGLVTLLVLFLVSMAEGLTLSTSEYIDSIDAELFVFRQGVDKSIRASSLSRSKLNDIERVAGVAAVGPIGFSTASIMLSGGEKLDVSLVGVEPGKPGAPPVFAGGEFPDERAREVMIDRHILDEVNIPVGSTISLEVLQGDEEKIYSLTVVGHTEGKKFTLSSIFVPLRVWDRIKPQEKPGGGGDIIFNMAAVKLANPESGPQMIKTIQGQVNRVELTDPVTAYQTDLGYREMQSIITIMQIFIMFVAVLVIGGFFQIQALQKIAQIGMLKAIGASSRVVVLTLLSQVMLTTTIGMVFGAAAVFALAASLPPSVALVFNGPKVITGVITLFLMGPIASFFSVRTLLKVEPLKALGLGL